LAAGDNITAASKENQLNRRSDDRRGVRCGAGDWSGGDAAGDLIEALFGELQRISVLGFLPGFAASLFVIVSVFLLKDGLALSVFSPDLAAATSANVARTDLYFLLVFSLTVLIGLRFMGALLASALIILPAATARSQPTTFHTTCSRPQRSASSQSSQDSCSLFSGFRLWGRGL